MAKVTYLDPIDHLSGKIAKAYRITYMHRSAATANTDNPNFTQVRRKRTTPLSENETNRRQLFAQIAKAVRLRMIDATQFQTDTTAFKKQTTYKTLYQFVWNTVANSL